MPLPVFLASSAERHSLVEGYILADDGVSPITTPMP